MNAIIGGSEIGDCPQLDIFRMGTPSEERHFRRPMAASQSFPLLRIGGRLCLMVGWTMLCRRGFNPTTNARSCKCQPSVLGRGSFLCAIPGVGSGFGSRSDCARSLRIALPSVQTADCPLTRFMTNTTDSMAVQYSPYDGFKIIAGCSL